MAYSGLRKAGVLLVAGSASIFSYAAYAQSVWPPPQDSVNTQGQTIPSNTKSSAPIDTTNGEIPSSTSQMLNDAGSAAKALITGGTEEPIQTSNSRVLPENLETPSQANSGTNNDNTASLPSPEPGTANQQIDGSPQGSAPTDSSDALFSNALSQTPQQLQATQDNANETIDAANTPASVPSQAAPDDSSSGPSPLMQVLGAIGGAYVMEKTGNADLAAGVMESTGVDPGTAQLATGAMGAMEPPASQTAAPSYRPAPSAETPPYNTPNQASSNCGVNWTGPCDR